MTGALLLAISLLATTPSVEIDCGSGMTVEAAGCGMDAQVKGVPDGTSWEDGCKRCNEALALKGVFDPCGGSGWCALPTDRFGRATYGVWLKAHSAPSPPPSPPPLAPEEPLSRDALYLAAAALAATAATAAALTASSARKSAVGSTASARDFSGSAQLSKRLESVRVAQASVDYEKLKAYTKLPKCKVTPPPQSDLAVAKACAARKQQKRDSEKVEVMSNTDTNASSDAASEMPGPSSA